MSMLSFARPCGWLLLLLVAQPVEAGSRAFAQVTGEEATEESSRGAWSGSRSAEDIQSAQSVARLAGLAKLWGAVWLFHPAAADGTLNWDEALLEAVPRARRASTVEEYRSALQQMLTELGDPETRILELRPNQAESFGEAPEDALAQPYLSVLEDGTALVRSTAYGRLAASSGGELLKAALLKARRSDLLVVDLRRQGPDLGGGWRLGAYLAAAAPTLIDRPLTLTTTRRRMHSGFNMAGSSSQAFYSAFLQAQAQQLFPVPVAERNGDGAAIRATPPLVFFINQGTPNRVMPVLGGLRAAGLARIVYQGSTPAGLQGGAGYRMRLPDGLSADIRLNQWLHPDGQVGFQPDRVIGAGEGRQMESLARIARQVLDRTPDRRLLEPRQARKLTAPRLTRADVPGEAFPPLEKRLLALFRYWNVVHYFSPYKELLDRPWEEALGEFIPSFAEASDALQYHLAAAGLGARTQDSLSAINSAVLTEFFGPAVPGFVLKVVERRPVVFEILKPEDVLGVEVGDVVVEVDGLPVGQHVERLASYLPASTPQSARLKAYSNLLGGPAGSKVELTLLKADGSLSEVSLPRSMGRRRVSRTRPKYEVLEDGIGYVDLDRLSVGESPLAYQAVRQARAIVFDLRGYPQGAAWPLASFLGREPAAAALSRRPEPASPDLDALRLTESLRRTRPSGGNPYQGQVVVLINEETIGQGEESCLMLQAAAEVTYVGTPSSGAAGEIAAVPLPGGLTGFVTVEGLHPLGGGSLQRRGIQPHVLASPTVEGVRQGRDEVLEAALAYLRGRR